MTKILTMMCFMAMFLVGVNSTSGQTQGNDPYVGTLKGIAAVFVVVEDLPNKGADTLGVTRESVQTDVELKLRMSGMRVVPSMEELFKVPGAPIIMVQVNVA